MKSADIAKILSISTISVSRALSGQDGVHHPTAFICQWDYSALKVIKELYEAGIRVPDDISVLGSGNTDMSSLSIPALTTMELNIDYACECTVKLLRRRIEKPDKPFENILIYGNFIERSSVRQLV